MADASKREKLSAAKKKLKEFKQKTHGKATGDVEDIVPISDKVNIDSSVTNGSVHNGRLPAHPANSTNDHSNVPLVDHNNDANMILSHTNNSSEHIGQLTRQMNGLITGSILPEKLTQHNDSSYELEILQQKNRELTLQLENYARTSDHLNKQLNDAKNQVQRLQQTLETERSAFDEKLKRELGTLKEQLQVHIQTIGILVAEKTELQSTLNQSQRSAEQQIVEREELSGRLKASRQRVAELEKNLGSAVSNNQKQEKANKEMSKEVDRLKIDLYKLNKSNEEFQQQVSELHGKLQKKNNECGKLEDDLIELKGKLEMSALHLQQLQAGGDKHQADVQHLEQLTVERNNLHNKLSQYEEAIQRLSREKEQSVAQYQAYIEQLQVQSRHLQAQVTTLLDDKEHVMAQRRELEVLVAELQSKNNNVSTEALEAIAVKKDLTDSVQRLRDELEQVKQQYNAQVSDNRELSKLLADQEVTLTQQHDELQRLSDSHVDHSKLLESMQSDKTALSRATAQNRELKNQLAELQNGFIKMSNENMELMTKLQSEQHIIKELSTRLTQQEEELEEIRAVLANKETQQMHLLAAHVERPREVSVSESESDAPGQHSSFAFVETLRRELATAQDTVNSLISQNTELRTRLVEQGVSTVSSSDKQLESLSTSVRQLEMERNEVMSQLKTEQKLRHDLQQRVLALQQQLETQEPATLDGQIVNKVQFEALHHAMKQLEEKYMRVMRDKADLVERLEATEHQLLQLQGETDTIGEYVSLYQTQRNALRQRQVLNDEYIAKMSREREDMQDKLKTLQALVLRMISERQSLVNTTVASPHFVMHVSPPAADEELVKEQAKADKILRRTLVTTSQEDWPDYATSSSEDEGESPDKPHKHSHHMPSPQQQQQLPAGTASVHVDSIISEQLNTSVQDDTAQQIMNLLHEIGRSSPEKSFTEFSVLQCSNCQGPLIHL